METLNDRQKEILTRIIESHIETKSPVGSHRLAECIELGLSSASLRHEMGVLEEFGYLTHPHTSAGRLPTDKGYQFYVKEKVAEEPVSEKILKLIVQEMARKIENLEGLMERASRILSAMAEEAVLMTAPQLRELYLKELSLVALDETRLLAVWCSTSGLVQDCLVEMESPISSQEIERIRNFINEEFEGEAIDGLEKALLKKIRSRRDSLRLIYQRTLEIIRRSLPAWSVPRMFVEGFRYILNQPEFQDVGKFRPLMETLEEKSPLVEVLALATAQQRIRVAIGENELPKEIWDCALVSAPYWWRGKCVGSIGILGPRRMPYGRIIGLAHQMADEIGQALDRWGAS